MLCNIYLGIQKYYYTRKYRQNLNFMCLLKKKFESCSTFLSLGSIKYELKKLNINQNNTKEHNSNNPNVYKQLEICQHILKIQRVKE